MLFMSQKPRLPVGSHLPWLTTVIACLATAFSLSDFLFVQGYFNKQLIHSGEIWRLLTGHITHTSLSHLSWDLLAFFVAASYLEYHNRKLLVISLAAGLIAVDLLLLSPWASIQSYAGLSGLLFAPLVPALFIFARKQADYSGWLPLGICLIKLIWELCSQQALFSQSNWPPYPAAHLAGFLGGVLVIIMHRYSEQSDLFRGQTAKLTGL